jgi:phosphotransacetylase
MGLGYKISIALGAILITTISASAWYIDRLQDNISTLKANSVILETQIKEQNEAIQKHLKNAEKLQQANNKLSSQNAETQREVTKLRQTFAKHDLDRLAIAKPQLIENTINRAVVKLKEDLIEITNPQQFDKEFIDEN